MPASPLPTGRVPLLCRRAVMAGGFGLAAGVAIARPARAGARPPVVPSAVPPTVPPGDSLVFQVSRNGSPIGLHRVDFSTGGGALTARIDAAFKVGFGFITFYRYHHQAEERWLDGSFHTLHSITDDNGSRFEVHATRVSNGILIRATGLPDQLVAANALPLTHWAIAAMGAPLFNPETGKMLREAATSRGTGTVTLADGTPISATATRWAARPRLRIGTINSRSGLR